MADFEALRKKIEALPPERQSQIEDFVEYLIDKARRLAAPAGLDATVPTLEADNTSPPNEGLDIERTE